MSKQSRAYKARCRKNNTDPDEIGRTRRKNSSLASYKVITRLIDRYFKDAYKRENGSSKHRERANFKAMFDI